MACEPVSCRSCVATVWEWDVAGGRPLRKARLPVDRPNAMPATLRIATTSTRVYLTTELVGGGEIRLTVMNRALGTTATRIVGAGQDVSLEADEHSIAVAFRLADTSDLPTSRRLRVVLYDPASVRPVAQTDLGATSMFSGLSLPDAIELYAGRLYVVGMPYRGHFTIFCSSSSAAGRDDCFALDLPSLRVARTYVSDASPSYQSRMLRHDGRLFSRGEEGSSS